MGLKARLNDIQRSHWKNRNHSYEIPGDFAILLRYSLNRDVVSAPEHDEMICWLGWILNRGSSRSIMKLSCSGYCQQLSHRSAGYLCAPLQCLSSGEVFLRSGRVLRVARGQSGSSLSMFVFAFRVNNCPPHAHYDNSQTAIASLQQQQSNLFCFIKRSAVRSTAFAYFNLIALCALL